MVTKTLNIYAYGLKKQTTLMLMFQPPDSSKLFRDQFPVVWKVINFSPNEFGTAMASVKYVAHLAFGYAQTDDNNLVDASAWKEVNEGDIASIVSGSELKRFGPTIHRSSTRLYVCKNKTDGRVDLTIGMVSGKNINQRFEPTLYWNDVGSNSNATAQFTPMLTAYVTREYQETQFLRGEVETDAIWKVNLNELDDVTGWNLIEKDSSGEFSIERANAV